MKIELLAAGVRPPAWVDAGYNEYGKRMPQACELVLKEIPVAKRTKNSSKAKWMAEEEARFRGQFVKGAHIVALDRSGKNWSTEDLAARLRNWMQDMPLVQLMVGGPDGLSAGCLTAANERWALSALTFPHFMVRVMIAEQLYRAWSLNNNHPYHK